MTTWRCTQAHPLPSSPCSLVCWLVWRRARTQLPCTPQKPTMLARQHLIHLHSKHHLQTRSRSVSSGRHCIVYLHPGAVDHVFQPSPVTVSPRSASFLQSARSIPDILHCRSCRRHRLTHNISHPRYAYVDKLLGAAFFLTAHPPPALSDQPSMRHRAC